MTNVRFFRSARLSKLAKLRLYWRTLRYLKKRQILYYVIRRALKYPRRISLPRSPSIRPGFALQPALTANKSYRAVGSFEFLRREIEFEEAIDWDCPNTPALWRYNLHYFDYLRQEDMRSEQGLALMQDWILRHQNMQGVGWHPYPVSLRLVNWIYFISSNFKTAPVQQCYVDSIALQAAWLVENIEHHILANHLFVNAKALLFAGGFLGGTLGDRCVTRGLDILRTELAEQFLDDGGHYERTPMYHQILTHDLIDLVNLFSTNRGVFSARDREAVITRTRAALVFLDQLEPPDHSMPFFNDSTDGIAPERTALVGFAHRIFGFKLEPRGEEMGVTSLSNSGYYVVRDVGSFLMIDCGDIGPEYQPGHAHCDTLSYEYFLNGRKFITNCGNFDYEISDERRFARCTAAHNTVVVDGEEQSEIWGAFRVARRARPIRAALTLAEQGHAKFSGAHNGYQRLRPAVVHERTVDYFTGGAFRVEDTLAAAGEHSVDSYVHFVAGLRIEPTESGFEIVDEGGDIVLRLVPFGADAVEIITTERYPEFGRREDALSLRIHKSAIAPFSFGYEVRP